MLLMKTIIEYNKMVDRRRLCSEGVLTEGSKLYLTIAYDDTESAKSLHILFDENLDLILVKFDIF